MKTWNTNQRTKSPPATPGWIWPWRTITVHAALTAFMSLRIIAPAPLDAGQFEEAAGASSEPVPPWIVSHPQNQARIENEPLALSVLAESESPMDYQWFKDGAPIRNNDRISGAREPNLSIESIRLHDAGTYTVEVSNEHGNVISQAAFVGVEEGLRIKIVGDQVMVSWPAKATDSLVRSEGLTGFGGWETMEEEPELVDDRYTHVLIRGDDPEFFAMAPVEDCAVRVYLDQPRWTKRLTDWPATANCQRSPRYVFGFRRMISIEVKMQGPIQNPLIVEVLNPETQAAVDIECIYDPAKRVYRNRVGSEDLYLSDKTLETQTGDFIHVREEEALTFRVKTDPTCSYEVMVDRGETAATTIQDRWATNVPFPVELEMNDFASRFIVGMISYPPPTTPYFLGGTHLRAPCNNPMGPYILKTGDYDPEDWETDIFLMAGHGWLDASISGRANSNIWCQHFMPTPLALFQKNPATTTNGPLVSPGDYYFGGIANPPTHFSIPSEWDTDIDWGIVGACLAFSDIKFSVNAHRLDAAGNIVGAGARIGLDRATWHQWLPAFTGQRRLHGLLGFADLVYGHRANNIIRDWTLHTGHGMSILRTWILATRAHGQAGAAVFYPNNAADRVDEMQRDPCLGFPEYFRSTLPNSTLRKRIGDKNFQAAGFHLADPVPNTSAEVNDADHAYFSGTPVTTLLNGQCSVWTDLPAIDGIFNRLLIRRNEQTVAGSSFTRNDEGLYRFDKNTPFYLNPNLLNEAQAEQNVWRVLRQNFLQVPETLTAVGTFPLMLTGATREFGSGFEVMLEQRYRSLPILDAQVYSLVTADGEVDLAEARFYTVQPFGLEQPLISAESAVELAGQDLLLRHPSIPCRLSGILAAYGYPTESPNDWREVRPVYGLSFNLNEAIYIIDAVTGAILETQFAE